MKAVGLGADPPMATISTSSMVEHQVPETAAALARHTCVSCLIPACKDALKSSLGDLLG